MFDIARIFDPIQSKIALFLGLLPRSRRDGRSSHQNRRIARNEEVGHGADNFQTKNKVPQRRRARGITSTGSIDHLAGPNSRTIRDTQYYYDSPVEDETCCIIKAENTLFKVRIIFRIKIYVLLIVLHPPQVHKLVLCRDGSAFERKLWFRHSGMFLGSSDATPLVIRASPEKFRDLLWVLHAFPPDFYLNPEEDLDESYSDLYVDFHSLSLHRLLNIAEMAHQYAFPSFECWSIHEICRLLKCTAPTRTKKIETSSTSSSATLISNSTGNGKTGLHAPELEEPIESLDQNDDMYSRLLLIALTCDHSSLLQYLVQSLVTKILWYNHVPGVLLVQMLERHRHHPILATLLGIVYYRILIDMPYKLDTDADALSDHYPRESQPVFPPTINVERRMQFLAAHQRLTQTWKDICSSPPPLHSSISSKGSSSRKALRPHNSCNESWRCLWRTACHQAQSRAYMDSHNPIPKTSASFSGKSADVLSLLKITMLQLRKLTACTSSICLDCSLEGLEAVDLLRDQLIENLIHMFVYES
ncbi:hypothetical protein BDP27DRAFT_75493 [Rhodocollybia butyracea]|uniref:Uncharacterized protein n=1 Tax=Rhodocollybia butyracea TaxID=206335 RepID=A0A9P5PL14_9AGAR|nr:hypothetical protein BDP27DRAFT_75493 [Rhodocollybia butyracea]